MTGAVDEEERRRLQAERAKCKAQADVLGQERDEGGPWSSLWEGEEGEGEDGGEEGARQTQETGNED